MMESIALALFGGALIGLAASAVLALAGRVAGISGIVGGLLSGQDVGWRLFFVLGLLTGGLGLAMFSPELLQGPAGRSLAMVAVAGGLVGFGTRLGNGCTSGHGVCGLTRFSWRSLVATLTFMATGFATATLFGLFGGAA